MLPLAEAHKWKIKLFHKKKIQLLTAPCRLMKCSFLFSVLKGMRLLSSISCTDDSHGIAFHIKLWFWKRIGWLTDWWLGLSRRRHFRHLVQQMEKRWCIFWLKFNWSKHVHCTKSTPSFFNRVHCCLVLLLVQNELNRLWGNVGKLHCLA